MSSRNPARESGRIELQLSQDQFAPGDTLSFTINVMARDRLTARALAAELLAVEEIELDEEDEFVDGYDDEEGEGDSNVIPMSFNGGADDDDDEEDEEEDLITNITFSEEQTLASNLSLKSGESRSFTGSFTIPNDAQPTYEGVQAIHTWWIDVYLEGDIEISESREIRVR